MPSQGLWPLRGIPVAGGEEGARSGSHEHAHPNTVWRHWIGVRWSMHLRRFESDNKSILLFSPTLKYLYHCAPQRIWHLAAAVWVLLSEVFLYMPHCLCLHVNPRELPFNTFIRSFQITMSRFLFTHVCVLSNWCGIVVVVRVGFGVWVLIWVVVRIMISVMVMVRVMVRVFKFHHYAIILGNSLAMVQ